ncbi:hypothetical protein EB796_000223 [Bugula neritina]|uniref:Uncharacterized protein n=1 Tax=Bugula neritina TaxID=10212 RepID=A0A7J7KTC1_BUGNE|nr:hypothetical protein EB796_000223 [Bugula neritina]
MSYCRTFNTILPPKYYILGNRFIPEFEQLKKDLTKDGNSYTVDPMFFTAGYDGPRVYFKRHNEVWITKA